mmetsp:Transcript_7713/g.22652  ORF Transcript_7713/g.22652 Transcript_7713/m.22652 type:complete len:253 (+) Transcript_7713:1636-2394(+)
MVVTRGTLLRAAATPGRSDPNSVRSSSTFWPKRPQRSNPPAERAPRRKEGPSILPGLVGSAARTPPCADSCARRRSRPAIWRRTGAETTRPLPGPSPSPSWAVSARGTSRPPRSFSARTCCSTRIETAAEEVKPCRKCFCASCAPLTRRGLSSITHSSSGGGGGYPPRPGPGPIPCRRCGAKWIRRRDRGRRGAATRVPAKGPSRGRGAPTSRWGESGSGKCCRGPSDREGRGRESSRGTKSRARLRWSTRA